MKIWKKMAWLLIGIPGMLASYFWVMIKDDYPGAFLINLPDYKLIERNPTSEAILAYLWVTVIILFHKWVHRGGFEETTKWEEAGFKATKGAVLGFFLGIASGSIDALTVGGLGEVAAITLAAGLIGLVVVRLFSDISLWYMAYGYIVVFLISALAVVCFGGWIFGIAFVCIWIIIFLLWVLITHRRSKKEEVLPRW